MEPSSLSELRGMAQLEELEFSSPRNPPALLETLATLPGLCKLRCNVPAGADSNCLGNLTRLEHLKLATRSRTDEGPHGYEDPVGEMKNLVKIERGWNQERYSWDQSGV